MLDHAEIRTHAEKDNKLFVVAGETSHDWVIRKV